jgi:hypothetical protein
LATLIQSSQLSAISFQPIPFDQCFGEPFAYTAHATLSKSPAKATWTSNAQFISKDKKRVLAKHVYQPRHLHTATGDMLSKDATLATTKLSKIVNRSVTSYRAHPSNNQLGRLTNGQRPTRQQKPSWHTGCLTSLWPLAVATPPMSDSPLRWKRKI